MGTRVIHVRIAPPIFTSCATSICAYHDDVNNGSSIIQNGAENADARLEYLRTYKLKTVNWSLKAGRLIETINRENKNKLLSYIFARYFALQHKASTGDIKEKWIQNTRLEPQEFQDFVLRSPNIERNKQKGIEIRKEENYGLLPVVIYRKPWSSSEFLAPKTKENERVHSFI